MNHNISSKSLEKRDGVVLCISCTFMIGSGNGGCFVEMRMILGSGYTALHIGHTNGENIVTGCITSLETGIYNVDIFDINNNGQKVSCHIVREGRLEYS